MVEHKSVAAVDPLFHLAVSDETHIRASFATGISFYFYELGQLVRSQKKPAVRILGVALESQDTITRELALRLFADIGSDARSMTPRIVRALGDENPIVRECAARALEWILPDDEQVVSPLTAALEDSDELVRVAAASALLAVSPTSAQATEMLKAGLRHDHPVVRRMASEALKTTERKDSIYSE